jgi:hypothetical protein
VKRLEHAVQRHRDAAHEAKQTQLAQTEARSHLREAENARDVAKNKLAVAESDSDAAEKQTMGPIITLTGPEKQTMGPRNRQWARVINVKGPGGSRPNFGRKFRFKFEFKRV